MVQSSAATVDAYLAGLPDEPRRAALTRLRELVRAELPGFTEEMAYGMPGYRRPGGELEVSFAAQARHLSVYLLRTDVMTAHADRLADRDTGKSCLRYRRPDALLADLPLLRDLLRATAASSGPVC